MQSTILIKKYLNKKLYIAKGNTEPTGYTNLQGIIDIIRKGKSVKVIDVVTGEDITTNILTSTLEYVNLSVGKLEELIRGQPSS